MPNKLYVSCKGRESKTMSKLYISQEITDWGHDMVLTQLFEGEEDPYRDDPYYRRVTLEEWQRFCGILKQGDE